MTTTLTTQTTIEAAMREADAAGEASNRANEALLAAQKWVAYVADKAKSDPQGWRAQAKMVARKLVEAQQKADEANAAAQAALERFEELAARYR